MFDMSGSRGHCTKNLINVRFFDDDFKYKHIDGVLANNLANECFNDVFTPKTDQFNICALFYQILNGIPPWHDNEKVDIDNKISLDAHIENRAYKLKLPEGIDEHLENFISKALNENSDERFRNLNDFSSYLKREKLLITKQAKVNKPKIKIGNGFNDIAGMDNLKNQLKTQVLDVLRKPDHFKKYGVTIPNGMLLYGPLDVERHLFLKNFVKKLHLIFYL